jgi:AcrR family transcriptional regulator
MGYHESECYGTKQYHVKGGVMASKKARSVENGADDSARGRILGAAMRTFMEHGVAAATTLEIATRAKVSKRELYALVGNKQEMLAACVAERGRRMRLPEGFPTPTDMASLRSALREYGATMLRELTSPGVLAVFRLAISESKRSPGVAASIDRLGSQPARAALQSLLQSARAAKLLAGGDLQAMMSHYRGMLWGDLLVWILLGTTPAPGEKEINDRADEVARLFLRLYGRDT